MSSQNWYIGDWCLHVYTPVVQTTSKFGMPISKAISTPLYIQLCIQFVPSSGIFYGTCTILCQFHGILFQHHIQECILYIVIAS